MLVPVPIIIPIILCCILKILLLYEEFSLNTTPQFITELKYEYYINFKVSYHISFG
jgi:hypothetical protein